MVQKCCVKFCHNRSDQKTYRRFYSIPNVITKKGESMKELTTRQRREWIAQLQLKTVTFESKARKHVCSDHFVNGVKAYPGDVNSPSWKPTLKLGHSLCKGVSAARYNRLCSRRTKKAAEQASRGEEISEPNDMSDETDSAAAGTPPPEQGEDGGRKCIDSGVPESRMACRWADCQQIRLPSHSFCLHHMNAGVWMSSLNVRDLINSNVMVNIGGPEGCTVTPATSSAPSTPNSGGGCREMKIQFDSSSLAAQPPQFSFSNNQNVLQGNFHRPIGVFPSSVTVSIPQSQNAMQFNGQSLRQSIDWRCQQQTLRTETSPRLVHPYQQYVSHMFPSPAVQQQNESAGLQQYKHDHMVADTHLQGPALRPAVLHHTSNDCGYRAQQWHRPVQEPGYEHVGHRHLSVSNNGPAVEQIVRPKQTEQAVRLCNPSMIAQITPSRDVTCRKDIGGIVDPCSSSNLLLTEGSPQTTHSKTLSSESSFVSTSNSAAATTAEPQPSPCSVASPALQTPAVNVGSAGVSCYDSDDIIVFEPDPKNRSIKYEPKEMAQTIGASAKSRSHDDDIIFFEPELQKRNIMLEPMEHASSSGTCMDSFSQQVPSMHNGEKQDMQAEQSDVAARVTFTVNEKIASKFSISTSDRLQNQDEHDKPESSNIFGDSAFTLESCSNPETNEQQEQISGTLDFRVMETYSLCADSSNQAKVTMSSASNSFEKLSAEGFFRCGNRDRSCSYLTQLPTQFEAHMRKEHASEKAFPCVHCGCVEMTIDSLLQHFEEHLALRGLLLYCVESICDFNSFSPEDVLHHIAVTHSTLTSFTCWHCSANFSSIHTFVTHVKENILQVVRCLHCSAKDTDCWRMLAHISSSHPGKGRMFSIHKILLCQERTLADWQAHNTEHAQLQEFSEHSSITSTICEQPPVPLKVSPIAHIPNLEQETDFIDLTSSWSDCETPEQVDSLSDDEIVIDLDKVGNEMSTDINTGRCADHDEFPVQWTTEKLELRDDGRSIVTAGENSHDKVYDRHVIGPCSRQSAEVMVEGSEASVDRNKHLKMEIIQNEEEVDCVATLSLVEIYSSEQLITTDCVSVTREENDPDELCEEEKKHVLNDREYGNHTKEQPENNILEDKSERVEEEIRCASDVAHSSTESGNEEKWLKCPYCKRKQLKTQTAVENEIRRHILYKPFSCPLCTEHPFESSSYQRVQRHIRETHPQICDCEVTVTRIHKKEEQFNHLLQKAINMSNVSTVQKSKTNVRRKYKICKLGSNARPQEHTAQKPSVPSSSLNGSQVALTSSNFMKGCSQIVSSRDGTIYSYSYTFTKDEQMNVFSQQNSTASVERKKKVLPGGTIARPRTKKAQRSNLLSSSSNKARMDLSHSNEDCFQVIKCGDENIYSCRLCRYTFITCKDTKSNKQKNYMHMWMHISNKHKKKSAGGLKIKKNIPE